MCDNFIIAYLSSTDASQVARGISIVEEKLGESNQFQPEDAVQIFPLLIPLLMHMHYKVRKNAFYLFLSILNRFSDYLDSTSDSVPNCLASLICVDEEIAECAHQALEFLFDLDDPKYWWPSCEKVLFNSKSTPQRIKLMFMLYNHVDEIPVLPIIKLLDDPIFTIQKIAYSMLQFNDQDMLQAELEKYRALLGIEVNPYELDMTPKQREKYLQMQEMMKSKKDQTKPARMVRRTRRARATDDMLATKRQAAEEQIQDEMMLQGEKTLKSANDHKVHSRFVSQQNPNMNTSPMRKRTKHGYMSYDNYHLSPNVTLNPNFNLDPHSNLNEDQYQDPNCFYPQNGMYDQNSNYGNFYGSNQQNFNPNQNRGNQQFQSFNQNDNNFNNNNYGNNNNNSYGSPQKMRDFNNSRFSQQNNNNPNNGFFNRPNNMNNSYNNGSNMNNSNNNNLFNKSNNMNNSNNSGLFNRSNNNMNNSNNNGQFNRSNNMNNSGNNNMFNRSNNMNNSNNNGLFNRSNSNMNDSNNMNNSNNMNSSGLFNRSNNSNNGQFNRSNNNANNMNNSNNNGLFNRSNNNMNNPNQGQFNNSNNNGLFNRSNNNMNNPNNNGLFNRSNNNMNNSNNNGLFNRSNNNANNMNNSNNNGLFNRSNNNANNMNNSNNNGLFNRSNNNMNNPNQGQFNNSNNNGLFNRSNNNMNNPNNNGLFNRSNNNNANNNFNNNGANNRNNNYNNNYNNNNMNNRFNNPNNNYNQSNYPNYNNNNNFNPNSNNQNYNGYNDNNNNSNYPNYNNNGQFDNDSQMAGSMFDQMYPTNQNASELFDQDNLYDDIIQQLGNNFNPNNTANRPAARSGKGGTTSNQAIGSPSKTEGDPLPFELIDLKTKNWEFRKNYLDNVHNVLTSTDQKYNYRHDYLMDCVMDAAKPANKKVSIVLSKVITDIILEDPGVIDPFLEEITNFMVLSVTQFYGLSQITNPSNSPKSVKSENASVSSKSATSPKTTKSGNLSASSRSATSPKTPKSKAEKSGNASVTSKSAISPKTPKSGNESVSSKTPKSTKSKSATSPRSGNASVSSKSLKSGKISVTSKNDDEDEIEEEQENEDDEQSVTPQEKSKVYEIKTTPSKTSRVVLRSKSMKKKKETTPKSKSFSKPLYVPDTPYTLRDLHDMSAFDDLIDAIILEVNPGKLINSLLDYPNRTSSHVEILIQKVYKRRPNLTLCRNDLERLLSFLAYDAYPLALKLGTMRNRKSQPAFLEAVIFILHKTSKNQPKIYASIVSLQNHEGMVEILSKFLPEEEMMNNDNINSRSITSNSYYRSGASNYRSTLNRSNNDSNNQNEYDNNNLNLPPMFILLRELKKSDNCSIDLLSDCFDRVSFNSPKHLLKVFLRFMSLLSRLSENKIKDNEDYLKRICSNHFSSQDLMSILSLKNVESEILVGLSRFIWFAPQQILNGADTYYENMYKMFTKSVGQERNALIIIAYSIEQVTRKSFLDLPCIAEPHQKVIERMLSQYENQNRD